MYKDADHFASEISLWPVNYVSCARLPFASALSDYLLVLKCAIKSFVPAELASVMTFRYSALRLSFKSFRTI